jgi:hypothetical protein
MDMTEQEENNEQVEHGVCGAYEAGEATDAERTRALGGTKREDRRNMSSSRISMTRRARKSRKAKGTEGAGSSGKGA